LSAPGFEKRVDDAGLMVALNRALLQEDDTLLLKIKIDALAGRLMLTGTVQDEAAQKNLQKIVGETDGIRQVFDYVQVGEERSFSKVAHDGLISTRLRTAMMTDQAISAVNFIIRTHRGVIYILGIASTEEEAIRVVNHARTISGVVEVKLKFETVDEMMLAFAAAEELSNAEASHER
jgi:osmotically-inducible protein OsmY